MEHLKKYILATVAILLPILFLFSKASYFYNLLPRYRESNPVQEVKKPTLEKAEDKKFQNDTAASTAIPTEPENSSVNVAEKLSSGGTVIPSRTADPPSVSAEKIIEDERIDKAFDSSDCEKVSGPTYGNRYYDGPLIDTHYHIFSIPEDEEDEEEEDEITPVLGENITIPDIVCTLKQEKTDKVFAFFPVYSELQKEHVEIVRRTMEKYPDKFVPFIMPPDEDDSEDGFPTVDDETFTEMLDIAPNLFQGYGEIGLYARTDGAPELPPNSKRLRDIYPIVRKNKLAVYFHLGEGQQDSFEKVLRNNRDINFIFHGDQLIPTNNNEQDLSVLKRIISRNPNVFYTIDELYGNQWMIKPEITKKEFLEYLEDYKPLLEYDLSVWEDVIERFPDQFMWGTDRSDQVLWSHDPKVGQALANYARAFIARLDKSVQEKFAYKNAERLLQSAVNN